MSTPEVAYKQGAIADLSEICGHLTEVTRGTDVGDRLLELLHQAAVLHSKHPGTGSLRSELGENVRCFQVWQYVAFFVPTEKGILIVRVIHGARDIPAEFHSR